MVRWHREDTTRAEARTDTLALAAPPDIRKFNALRRELCAPDIKSCSALTFYIHG
jgi:hypothetical protein